MQRRSVLKRLGAAGLTAGLASTPASAAVEGPDLGIEDQLDVSDVSGTVPLEDLLDGPVEEEVSDEFLDWLDDDVDPAKLQLTVNNISECEHTTLCNHQCCRCDCLGDCCICNPCGSYYA